MKSELRDPAKVTGSLPWGGWSCQSAPPCAGSWPLLPPHVERGAIDVASSSGHT